MKPMRLQEVVKLLESHGFTLVRSNGHDIYSNGRVSIALAHQRVVTPGVMRSVTKAIERANSGFNERKVYANH